MKAPDKITNSITLKEYINTTNIRRMVISRTKSKEKEKQRKSNSTSRMTYQKQAKEGYLHLNKEQLAQEIKLKIAEMIPNNIDMLPLFNMLDRLIELFTSQLNKQAKQNQITASMLKDCSRLPLQSKYQKETKEKKHYQSENKISQGDANHVKQSVQEDNLNQSYLHIDDCRARSDSCSSQDVPNINLLLISRRQQYPQSQMQKQTKATFNQFSNNNMSFRSSFKNETSFFQKLENDERKKKSVIGSISPAIYSHPQSAPVSCRNSQIKFSMTSQIWNNVTQTQNALARFQEYKMKSRR